MASHERYLKIHPYRQDEQGRALCRLCGKVVPAGRRSWCSQTCVQTYLRKSSSQAIRMEVFRRDHGRCAVCGCDAPAEYRRWCEAVLEIERYIAWLARVNRLRTGWIDGRWQFLNADQPTVSWTEREQAKAEMLARCGMPSWRANTTSGWEADHIVPVVEGGGSCELDNLRTLCIPCHRRETAKLAGRHAARKRLRRLVAAGDLFPQS